MKFDKIKKVGNCSLLSLWYIAVRIKAREKPTSFLLRLTYNTRKTKIFHDLLQA